MQGKKTSPRKVVSYEPNIFHPATTYREEVDSIKHSVEQKYSNAILQERNMIKQMMLRIQMNSEIQEELKKRHSS